MSGHAPFPPSAAKRWMTCTASFALGLQVPEAPESEYAAEGTRLHDVAAGVLTGAHTGATPEDRAFLKPYLTYAAQRMAKAADFAIEERLNHSPLLFGTPDLRLLFNGKVNLPNGLLEIVDLKNGAGIMVEPKENEQLMTYAYMALVKRLPGYTPKNVRLTIVQPPDEARPVKSWDTTSERIAEHGAAAEAAIQTALEGRGELQTGDHCRFCKARAICPKLRGDVVEALASGLPATMSKASLGHWLDRAERVEGFIKDLREIAHRTAEEAMMTGKPGIPGWMLKPKRATRQWADEDKVLEIARRRRIKIWQDKLLSPAMAEKAHPNMPEELQQQIIAVSSGSNLVRGESPHKVLAPDASPMAKLAANLSLKKL